jgi:septal ring factor EnvC (AmiA/AmiB activator)
MGFKASATAGSLVVLLFLTPATIYADTANDLYDLYDMKYEDSIPEDVIDTISRYNYAQKYVSMFQYVAVSEYDTDLINAKIDQLESNLESLTDQLLAGYDLSMDEIYTLEDEYNETYTKLQDAKDSLQTVEIDFDTPTVDNTPTYSEYKEALQKKSKLVTEAELGEISDLSYPVTTAALESDRTFTSLTLAVADGATITSLFNGTVALTDDNSITIDHHNGIYTYYGGLTSYYVRPGDTVYQGQSIGTSGNKVILKLKIDGKLVDISKLF